MTIERTPCASGKVPRPTGAVSEPNRVLLGYSEQSALNRSCRWLGGCTPRRAYGGVRWSVKRVKLQP